MVNGSELKKEKERDELWKQLDQLKLDHDRKKSTSVSTVRPNSRRAPPKSVLSSSGFPKSAFSAKSL